MSTDTTTDIDIPEYEKRREENLEKLYELRDELRTIADSDAEYAEYAENFLQSLEEAGYDV